jgi:hypothetical protein
LFLFTVEVICCFLTLPKKSRNSVWQNPAG